MASEVKVQVIQGVTIKPSSPTPDHLKTTNLSVFDQLVPTVYIPLLLFYSNDINSHEYRDDNQYHSALVAERSKLLRRSLSEALTHFYPFAGEFRYNASISCNDDGVAFLEAQVNCPVSNILDKPDLGMLWKFIPSEFDHRLRGYLLLVQATFFECGGLAIGVNVSHKVADASTLSKFLSRWAAIALGSASTDDRVVLPVEFGHAASLFPPLDFLNSPPKPGGAVNPGIKEKCTTRRFVFDGSKISALKAKAAGTTSVSNPTRIEVVSALIWKCALEASRSKSGSVRPSAWCQTVNLRNILPQALAGKDLPGNVVGLAAAKTEEISSEVDGDHDLQRLVTILRKGIEGFKEYHSNGVSGEDLHQQFMETVDLIINRDDIESYSCTSWCRFPFYESNFGWGKPSWVFTPSVDSKNMIILMDTRDGDGLEACLSFKEEDMAKFEYNKELLEYASCNPPARSYQKSRKNSYWLHR